VQIDCATLNQHPQTFRGNQGTVKYHLRTQNQLHGIFVYGNDLQSGAIAGLAIARVNQAGGVKSDGEIGISGGSTTVRLHPDRATNEDQERELRPQHQHVRLFWSINARKQSCRGSTPRR